MTKEQYKQYLNDISENPYSALEYKKENNTSAGKLAQKGFEILGNGLKDLWNGLTGKTSANATLEANKMNIENQNYWNMMTMQREDTAHQREMADLQAAGLNPWLSAGGSAQTSTLSTAQAEPVDGSKMLQATSAMALLAITRLLSRDQSRTIYKK